ncbi:MAG: dihydroorotate dehydrogenase electron transfer subunit [Actinomycetia bacterium]|nr:dihydroorotate dehydrogenase electron transfer subunit [Actinomycetes bacterium]
MPSKFLEDAQVLGNERFAPDLWSLTLYAPRIAEAIAPGQFVSLALGDSARLLRRPLSVFQSDAAEGTIELLYQVVGEGTGLMASWQEDEIRSLLGPLGNTWPIAEGVQTALLVGGGIGTAPLALLALELRKRGVVVTMLQAAQTAERLVARGFFEDTVAAWICATDDGSAGTQGLITTPLAELLDREDFDVAYICGPEVMQTAVAALCAQHALRCYVSLERRMACGIGACAGCVVTTTQGLKGVCAAGPIFDAKEVCWDDNIASRVH